jgi:hypothetical protein
MGYVPNIPGPRVQSTTGLHAYVNEPFGAVNWRDYNWARSIANGVGTASATWSYTWGPPPQAVSVSQLKLRAWMRTSQQGPSFFSANPQCRGFVDPTGTKYYDGTTHTITKNLNTNTQIPNSNRAQLVELGTWTTNPETALAWTLSDLTSGVFRAGVETTGVNIPHSNGATQAGLDVIVIVAEITVTPINTSADLVRSLFSRVLRRNRSARRYFSISGGPRLFDREPGDSLWVASDLMPDEDGDGTTSADYDRQPLFVTSTTIEPMSKSVEVVVEDNRENHCLFWSTFRTSIGATDDWNGVPRVDQGQGPTTARAQIGYLTRPVDFLMRDAASGDWRVTAWGLAINAGEAGGNGGNVWYPTYNTFSAGSFTGWTFVANGGTKAVGTPGIAPNTSGLAQSAILTSNPVFAAATYLHQTTTGWTANWKIRVRLQGRTLTGQSTYPRMILRRSVDGFDYVFPTTGWTGGGGWQDISAATAGTTGYYRVLPDGLDGFETVGQSWWEWWSPEVDVGGSGTNLQLFVSPPHENSGKAEFLQAAKTSNFGATGLGANVITRDPVITTSANLAQLRDEVSFANTSDSRIVYPDRGTLTFCFTPQWSHEDLPLTSVKYLASIWFDSVNDDYFELYYYANASSGSSAGQLFFRLFYGGALSVQAIANLTFSETGDNPRDTFRRGFTNKITARWIGSSGEFGETANTLRVFLTGRPGTTGPGRVMSAASAAAANMPRTNSAGTERLVLGNNTANSSINGTADGYFCDMDIRRNPMSEKAIWRLHDRIGRNLPTWAS